MRIVVLAGGISTERDVSLSSGAMIYRALKERGHQAVLLDVYLGYRWEEEAFPDVSEGERPGAVFGLKKDWAKEMGKIEEKNPDIEKIKALRPDGAKNFFGPNVIPICQAADVVFLALHGENGENGKIQACFDLMGITYTGTNYLSSAISMNKGISKELFAANGIPTPWGFRLKKGETGEKKTVFPCIVKACSGGSSVGVAIAGSEDDYEAALAEAFTYDDEVIVEQYISGREFSVGVMDGKALPVIEIAPLTGFYDYKNKYQPGTTVETCPADIPEEKSKELQACAEKVFAALRLESYARMDFRMNQEGEIFCLEANTLPGMTPISLLPQEAAAVGMDFGDLCERILESALHKE
ncbi:MAG: D-alanine--D-alanine ligase [Lachnospiraceae bacterium]|nr:D-alanine--D-alanine ligase [Lachnospiraceae bacterium]